MLSRRHIRVKVLQTLYAYHSAGEEQILPLLEKNLNRGIDKFYALYLYQLLVFRELGTFIEKYIQDTTANLPQARSAINHQRYLQSHAYRLTSESEAFQRALSRYNVVWEAEDNLLRKLFLHVKSSELYIEFINTDNPNPGLELALYEHILKAATVELPALSNHFEESFFNWHDDQKITHQMVVKSLKNMVTGGSADSFIIQLADDAEETVTFSRELLRNYVKSNSTIKEKVEEKVQKWEPHQLALIDYIILNMAVAEFLFFPSIPPKVTINEYLEVAKNYSTEKSRKFVNGVLDAILRDMRDAGQIKKTGRGLINN